MLSIAGWGKRNRQRKGVEKFSDLGGMPLLVQNEGSLIAIEADDFIEPILLLTLGQWIALIVGCGLVLATLTLMMIDPTLYRDDKFPVLVVACASVPIGAFLAIRYIAASISMMPDIAAIYFDLDAEQIIVISNGLFGWTRSTLPIAHVSHIRMGRGGWDGARVTDTTIVSLVTGKILLLPQVLTADQLTLLKVVTGARR